MPECFRVSEQLVRGEISGGVGIAHAEVIVSVLAHHEFGQIEAALEREDDVVALEAERVIQISQLDQWRGWQGWLRRTRRIALNDDVAPATALDYGKRTNKVILRCQAQAARACRRFRD